MSAPGTGTWQHLALTFNGASITAAINGTTVTTVTDSTYASGYVGFGTSGYQTDQFDNLSVTPVGGSTGGGSTGPITAGVNSAKCVDDNGQSSANGTKIQIWDCNGGANQSWTVASNGTVQVFGKCLDITGASTANGALIELWTCNGGANQQWQASNGDAGQPGLRQVPGRPGVQHRQRHPARPVDLQRRHQPAMAPALTRPAVLAAHRPLAAAGAQPGQPEPHACVHESPIEYRRSPMTVRSIQKRLGLSRRSGAAWAARAARAARPRQQMLTAAAALRDGRRAGRGNAGRGKGRPRRLAARCGRPPRRRASTSSRSPGT